MYGVILWSDPDVRKAVIWCEDNGALAYYEAPDEPHKASQTFFDAGDYVEFEMSEDRGPRRVVNAQTLLTAQSPRGNRTLREGEDTLDDVASELIASSLERAIRFVDQPSATTRSGREFNHRG